MSPLYARFDVTDSTGSIISATDALSFLFAGDSAGGREVDVRMTTTYVIRGADLTSSDEGKANRDLIRDLANRVNDGDRIVIKPVIEMRGASLVTGERIRQELQHIANALFIELGQKNVAITMDAGADPHLREREAAEFDILSRLISITLERDLGTASGSK